MAEAGITHDIVLTKHDASTPRGLLLSLDENGFPRYQATLQPPLPTEDSVVRQDSWHLGFGDYLVRQRDPYRYAYSDGLDAATPGEVKLANAVSSNRLDFALRNPGAEQGAIPDPDPFAKLTTTVALDTGTVRHGTNSWKCDTQGNAAGEYVAFTPTVVNGNVNGLTLTFYVWVNTNHPNVKAFIYDGDDTVSAGVTVVSSAHPRGSAWRLLSVQHTMGNTNFRVGVVNNTSAGVVQWYIDGAWIKFSAAATAMTPTVGPIQIADEQYVASGSAILKWNKTNDIYEINAVTATDGDNNAITAMAVHGPNIYVGTATSYFYSPGGADILATFVTGDDADLLVKGADRNGDSRLYRMDNSNNIHISKEATIGGPVTTSDWETAIQVGTQDSQISAMFPTFDTVLIGKSDGIYYFYPPDDKFRPATEQARLSPNVENFDKGSEYTDGWFYTTTARHGLVRLRFEGGDILFQPVPADYQADMYDQFGGRIRVLGTDGEWLYGLYDQATLNTDSAKKVYLMKAHYESLPQGARMIWHTLKQVSMGIPDTMFIGSDYLWASGRYCHGGQIVSGAANTEYEQTIYRMNLSTQHENMRKEVTPAHETSGTLVTGIIDLDEEGYSVDDMGLIKVIVYGENLSANKTITVAYQKDAAIDDASGGTWTAVGAAITALTNNRATVAFPAGSTAGRLRLRFTLATNDVTDSPILRAFRMHLAPHPTQWLLWEVTVRVQTNDTLLNQTESLDTAKNIWADIQTLYKEEYPLKMHDIEGTTYNATIVGLAKALVARRSEGSGGSQSEHVDFTVTLVIREALTT
jgi:hypothetical protein